MPSLTAKTLAADIQRNVEDFYADRISYAEFSKRAQGHWGRARDSGLSAQVAAIARAAIDKARAA